MLRTDYLRRICARGVVNDVFTSGRKAFEPGDSPTDVPTMPIEFSIAAFRLGHSMIRSTYNWNTVFDAGSGSLELRFVFPRAAGNLGGGRRLPSIWIADFRRPVRLREAGRENLVVSEDKFNRAMRLDTKISPAERTLTFLASPRTRRIWRSATWHAGRWSGWQPDSRWRGSRGTRACP